jgi:hypothetical protein
MYLIETPQCSPQRPQRQGGVKPVKAWHSVTHGIAKTTEDTLQATARNKGFSLSVLAGTGLMMGLVKLTDITKKDVLGPWMTSISIAFVAQAARRKEAIDLFEHPHPQARLILNKPYKPCLKMQAT